MTRQGKRPFFGIYFAIVLLLLAAYYLYESMGTTMITYAQVQDLFRSEQVESFYVKDGDSLYLSLRGGLLVRNELGSVAAFREDLGELIAEQREQGILKDYDYAPVYTPPWWSEILMYVVMIGIIFLFFQYMVGRAQGGSGIGLSIVRKIIEDHGGYIWATSREKEGTCMHFVIRKYQAPPEQ